MNSCEIFEVKTTKNRIISKNSIKYTFIDQNMRLYIVPMKMIKRKLFLNYI